MRESAIRRAVPRTYALGEWHSWLSLFVLPPAQPSSRHSEERLLSKEEFLRRGMALEFFKAFVVHPHMILPAESREVEVAKGIVGLTPEIEAQHRTELDEQAISHEKAINQADCKASEYAKQFKAGMENWNALLRRYLEAK